MSPVRFDHDENSPNCHHCHITEPIPLAELIRTHPLRSVVAKNDHEDETPDITEEKTKKTVTENGSHNGNLIHNLLEEVANHEFNNRRKNTASPSSTSADTSASHSLNRDKPPKLVRPVHSFLHHVSETSNYKTSTIPPAPEPRDLGEPSSPFDLGNHSFKKAEQTPASRDLGEPSSAFDLGNLNFKKAEQRPVSSDFTLETKTVSSQPEYSTPISRVSQAKSVSSIRSGSPVIPDGYSTLTREGEMYTKVLRLKDTETQTSKSGTLSKVTLAKLRNCASGVSSTIVKHSRRRRQKRCGSFMCSFPSGLLCAGYGLLIVIGIVVAVALSQRERRISQSSPFPRPPVISGARSAPQPGRVAIRTPAAPQQRISTSTRRRLRPIPRVSPVQPSSPSFPPRPSFPGAIPLPLPAPAPAPLPARNIQIFKDEDFDYLQDLTFDDNDFLLPAQKPQSRPQPQPRPQQPQQRPQPQPRPQQPKPQQAFRPVEIKPQFRAQAPVLVQDVRPRPQPQQQASSPRRGTPTSFRQEFNNQNQRPAEEVPRGQREPEVQIIKSWSNRNADGTFSWGYVNTDGSFKNETKGTDCVVTGVYGYVDKDTGETLSFPYQSGNPCDPNAPDYYDYDEEGQVIRRPTKPQPSSRRRNQ